MITSFVFSCVSLFCNIQKKERKIFIPNEPFHVGFRYWWSLNGLCFYLPFSIVKVKRNRQKNPKLSKKTDYQLFGFFFADQQLLLLLVNGKTRRNKFNLILSTCCLVYNSPNFVCFCFFLLVSSFSSFLFPNDNKHVIFKFQS